MTETREDIRRYLNETTEEAKAEPDLMNLLSCPFCGSANLVLKGENTFYYYILCGDCIANGPINGIKNEAIRLWNLRLTVQRDAMAEIEALEKMQKQCSSD